MSTSIDRFAQNAVTVWNDTLTHFQTGLAYSSDGINWTREPLNPVLPTGPAGEWDRFQAADVAVVVTHDTLRMFYTEIDSATTPWPNYFFEIGYAKAPPPADADLLHAYLGGDAHAFERLLRRYEKPLFTFIMRMVGNRHDAEDLFQDTLNRALKKIESYDERGKFCSWLFGIAHHLCVDRMRRRERWKLIFIRGKQAEEQLPDQVFEDPASLPDTLLEQKELLEMIAQALKHLSTEQREIFLLRQHSGLTVREIAEMVDRPLNTVLSQMRLAVLSIRAFLQE